MQPKKIGQKNCVDILLNTEHNILNTKEDYESNGIQQTVKNSHIMCITIITLSYEKSTLIYGDKLGVVIVGFRAVYGKL